MLLFSDSDYNDFYTEYLFVFLRCVYQRDLHNGYRRQRQMFIRDSPGTRVESCCGMRLDAPPPGPRGGLSLIHKSELKRRIVITSAAYSRKKKNYTKQHIVSLPLLKPKKTLLLYIHEPLLKLLYARLLRV